MFTIRIIQILYLSSYFLSISSCSNDNNKKTHTEKKTESIDKKENAKPDKGIGPIKHIELTSINPTSAENGKIIFEAKCTSCHREYNYVGPSLKGITNRRSPEWIMNMMLNPEGMTQKDPIAKQQLQEYRTQMSYQGVNEIEARNMLEYFRVKDQKK